MTRASICHTVWHLTAKVIQGQLHFVKPLHHFASRTLQGWFLIVYVMYHLIISFIPCAKPDLDELIISSGTAA